MLLKRNLALESFPTTSYKGLNLSSSIPDAGGWFHQPPRPSRFCSRAEGNPSALLPWNGVWWRCFRQDRSAHTELDWAKHAHVHRPAKPLAPKHSAVLGGSSPMWLNPAGLSTRFWALPWGQHSCWTSMGWTCKCQGSAPPNPWGEAASTSAVLNEYNRVHRLVKYSFYLFIQIVWITRISFP